MFFSRASMAAALLGVSQATLNFPVVKPAYDTYGIINAGLKTAMQPVKYTAELLEPGWVPETCFNGVYLDGINGRDIDVYNVTFADCDEPFIVCRHKNTKASPDVIFTVCSGLFLPLLDII